MNNILTIMKKELFRFFHDKRMVLTVLLVPGLSIYILYSFMGDAFSKLGKVDEEYKTSAYVENMPENLKPAFDSLSLDYKDTKSCDEMKNDVKDKNVDVYISFPENFTQKVDAYDALNSTKEAPQVKIYYNSSKKESEGIYSKITAILAQYENTMANKFNVNEEAGDNQKYDLASDKDITGILYSMLFPMLLMSLTFSACMAIAPESIAGEKERGTLVTVLCTPVKRSELAVGKIASLSIIAVLGGCSSFIGTMFALPKLMKVNANGVSANVYTAQDYLLLFLIVFCSVLFIISLISIISAFAKTVKEAGTLVTPLMIIVMLISFSSMFTNSTGGTKNVSLYFIPLYNSIQSMTGIFAFDFSFAGIVVTIISNIAYALIGVVVLSKMFSSEKVMLSK